MQQREELVPVKQEGHLLTAGRALRGAGGLGWTGGGAAAAEGQ